MDGNNLHAVSTFTGTKDESWFYIVHGLLELAAVPGLKAITHAYCSVMNHDHQGLAQDLLTVRDTLEQMLETLLKMYEQCDPKVFFVKIRPFLAGSKGLQAFPAGLLYEGVNPEPLQYHGASAAQSSSVHVRCVPRGLHTLAVTLSFCRPCDTTCQPSTGTFWKR